MILPVLQCTTIKKKQTKDLALTKLTHFQNKKMKEDTFTYLCVQSWSIKDGKMMLSDVLNSML